MKNPNNTVYKVIFLYSKKGFTIQEIQMVLDISTKEIDHIIDQEFKSIQNVNRIAMRYYARDFEL